MSTDLEFMREQQRIAGEALGIKPQLSISGGEDGKLAFPWTRRTEFNEITLVEDILVRHNYAGADGRYAPPTATGLPGIREIPARDGLWQSDHASDPLFGTFDAWTAYVVLDHDGDFDAAVLAAQGILTKYISELFEVINTEPNTPETLPAFGRDKQGQIFATKQNVMLALKRADICGVDLRHDEFRDEVMLAQPGTEDWRAFRDTDYTRICLTLEHGSNGFKDISKEKIRDSVAYVAEGNRFDSAQHWLGQQVWDGVPRVERSIINYFSAEDSLYTRAVGLYLWTALAGRVLHPGIKADMVPVAVGIQGSRKSSTVASISPAADFFLELDLGGKDDDLARLMRGKLIIELGELKGLRAREVEHLKSFITRTHESWVPKFKEMSVHYARRCVFFGTTNKSEFLADDTGHRRWLPFETGQCNPSAMERDRGQLWAEGRELFKKKGVAWEAAEQLAGAEHEKFVVHDAWEDRVAEWLTTPDDFEGVCPGDKPLTASGALLGAIGLGTQHSNKSHLDRMASVLKALGYGPDRAYIGGKRARAWVKNA